MTRARFLILSIGLVTVPTTGVLGQSANGLNCQNVRNYLSCALQAAGIAELASTTVAQGERELRFWITSGNMMPEKLLVLRQHGDSASGRLLLIWRGRTMELPFASSVCLDRWSNAAGGLCVGRLREAQDWVAIAQRLDRAGLAQVPRAPVPEQPCDRTPTPPSAPGQLPIDHLCAAMADGFDHALSCARLPAIGAINFREYPIRLPLARCAIGCCSNLDLCVAVCRRRTVSRRNSALTGACCGRGLKRSAAALS